MRKGALAPSIVLSSKVRNPFGGSIVSDLREGTTIKVYLEKGKKPPWGALTAG